MKWKSEKAFVTQNSKNTFDGAGSRRQRQGHHKIGLFAIVECWAKSYKSWLKSIFQSRENSLN